MWWLELGGKTLAAVWAMQVIWIGSSYVEDVVKSHLEPKDGIGSEKRTNTADIIYLRDRRRF